MINGAVRKFLRLSGTDRSLLGRSVVLVAVARVALWVLPFNVARRLVSSGGRRSSALIAPEKIGWAVSAAKRFVPKADCLPQALAAERLLTRFGHPVEFRIGVVKSGRNRLLAHAWVESNGKLVVGDLTQGLSMYAPLSPLPAPRT
jgi:hypothetical protein